MTTTTTTATDPQVRLPMAARYAMAACGVLAPTLMIVAIALDPVDSGLEGADAVQALEANIDAFLLPGWLYAIAAFLWVPALLMVGRVARANAPALGLAGLILAFGLAISVGPDPYDLAYLGLKSGLDVDATFALVESADNLPSAVLGFSWLLGLIGLVILGIAILRGKSAPVWSGVALIVAPVAMPLSWFAVSGVALLATWVVLAAGFAGCALAFLSQPAHVDVGAR